MLMHILWSAAVLVAALLLPAAAAARTSLPRSTPEREGVDSAALLGFVEALDNKIHSVHGLMLVRHGKVVAEGWWAPYSAEEPHILYSVSKSLTGTAVGMAQAEGLLNVDELVVSHFPELVPGKPEQMKNMRIRDLLRMTTGHQSDSNPIIKANRDGAWTRAFFETEVPHEPGTHFVYNSGASYMLSAIVQKASRLNLVEYLGPRLFTPLGIDLPLWGKSPEGVTLGDGGLTLRTEDLAKFGLLYLQKGLWQGQRLLPEAWVEESTARQTSTGSNPDNPWDYGYGYQFWQNKGGGYRADGAFGQFCIVLPEQDAVLVITSGTSDMKGVMDAVYDELSPAFHERALPDNRVLSDQLQKKLAGLSLPVQSGTSSAALAPSISGKFYGFAPNELGISAASVDASSPNPHITFVDADGSHVIACGFGSWVQGTTAFQKRISNVFENDRQPIAASCAWTDDHTFVAKLCFNQTPYTISSRFSFEPSRLFIDLEHNLRWGETKRPRLVGKR
jgi:CubicO group peptidase (beta-lactamase class C family)